MNNLSTNDYLLLSQFKTWRYGYQTRRTKNEVLDNMLYCQFRRSPREIWRKAKECLSQTENVDLRAYFGRIADKFKTITIFGQ